MTDAAIRVVLADDQTLVREGLTLMLGLMPGIEVVGVAEDGEAAVAMVLAERPDVALLDLRMPRLDGVEATARLRAQLPELEVVVLERVRSQANGVVVSSTPGSSTCGVDVGSFWQSFELQMRSLPLVMMYSCAPVPTSNVHGCVPALTIFIEIIGFSSDL